MTTYTSGFLLTLRSPGAVSSLSTSYVGHALRSGSWSPLSQLRIKVQKYILQSLDQGGVSVLVATTLEARFGHEANHSSGSYHIILTGTNLCLNLFWWQRQPDPWPAAPNLPWRHTTLPVAQTERSCRTGWGDKRIATYLMDTELWRQQNMFNLNADLGRFLYQSITTGERCTWIGVSSAAETRSHPEITIQGSHISAG